MLLYTVTTYPNERQKKDNYETFQNEQDWYFGTLAKNGQVILEDSNTIFQDGKYITYLIVPEHNSLDSRNENRYVRECYSKLLSLSKAPPEAVLIGKSADYEPSCDCASPSWYMLYTDYTINESPVVCGDCGKTVPLYRLPKILDEEEYYSVLEWQKTYKACDNLFLGGLGERFAYGQMYRYDSELSKRGRKICSAFENAMGKPFYYYLFRYYSRHKSTCPDCGALWKLGTGNEKFIDYCCENCRLVADKVKRK